jgi:hypothetical protein
VVAATTLSLIAVVAAYAVLLERVVRDVVIGWELEQLGAIAHHVADMASKEQVATRHDVVARLAEDHRTFGVEISLIKQPDRPSPSVVTVPLAEADEYVRVEASEPIIAALSERFRTSCWLLAIGAVLTVVAAVEGSVYWGLVRPLRAVRRQLKLMRRGPWGVSATPLGAHEVASLAYDVEAVGHTLDRKVSSWIETERRAALEQARVQLRQRLIEPVREINLAVSDLLARRTLDGPLARRARLLVRAAERLRDLVEGDEPAPGETEPENNRLETVSSGKKGAAE